MSKKKLAVIALIIANIIWGGASPLFKWALKDIHPFTLAFLRFVVPALFLLLVAPGITKIRKRDFGLFFFAAFFDVTINIGAFFLGIEKTASINAPIISSSGPVFLIIASILFLKEHPTKKMLLGNLLGLTGVLLIVIEPLIYSQHDGSTFSGNLLLIGATIASIFGTISIKKLARRYSALTILFWTFILGGLPFLPLSLQEVTKFGILPQLQFQGLIGVLYGIVFSSFIAYGLYYFALRHLFATQTSVFTYMDPVVAILIAAPLLGEYPDFFFIAGSILVFLGIFIAEGRLHYHPLHLLFRK